MDLGAPLPFVRRGRAAVSATPLASSPSTARPRSGAARRGSQRGHYPTDRLAAGGYAEWHDLGCGTAVCSWFPPCDRSLGGCVHRVVGQTRDARFLLPKGRERPVSSLALVHKIPGMTGRCPPLRRPDGVVVSMVTLRVHRGCGAYEATDDPSGRRSSASPCWAEPGYFTPAVSGVTPG